MYEYYGLKSLSIYGRHLDNNAAVVTSIPPLLLCLVTRRGQDFHTVAIGKPIPYIRCTQFSHYRYFRVLFIPWCLHLPNPPHSSVSPVCVHPFSFSLHVTADRHI